VERLDACQSKRSDDGATAQAFDLLILGGEGLRRTPYVERKAALRKLLRGGRGIQYVESTLVPKQFIAPAHSTSLMRSISNASMHSTSRCFMTMANMLKALKRPT